MGKESFSGPIERVDACCWRIPKSYKAGMRVDGMVFASEEMVATIRKDQAAEQVANVAFLPGIQGASLAMPDIHWGYGFCIGGVAATDPAEGGVISPGGIGYDINCLTGDSMVMHEHGYTRRIADMAEAWKTDRLACYRLDEASPESAQACHWFGQQPQAAVLELTTAGGDTVRATADHPFWTPDGMVPLGKLSVGDQVAVSPFAGIPYEDPSDEIILSEERLTELLTELGKGDDGNGLVQIRHYLRDRGLLPLRYSSPAMPYLCKLLGFVLGDGSIHFSDDECVTSFFGDAPDLDAIGADIEALGIKPSRISRRDRDHQIDMTYGSYEFPRTVESCKVVGTGFAALLIALGAPHGNKAKQSYGLPRWLRHAPLWQKRLFLAAYFGAELTPATMTCRGKVFAAPVVSMNKRGNAVESGRQFFEQMSEMLAEFGVETQDIACRAEQTNKYGEQSLRWRLILTPKAESLHNLWAKIGFAYNQKRSHQAALAVQYLKHKQRHLKERRAGATIAVSLYRTGVPQREIMAQLAGPVANRRYIERSLYENANRPPCVADSFPTFKHFCKDAAVGESGGMVWERIERIQTVESAGWVYDFTVNHPDHNFVANGFVVSNCGVRLIKTNLFYRDVKPHLRELVEDLFRNIPTGVGRSGRYKFDKRELKQLLTDGSRYLAARDFVTAEDIAHTEAFGRIDEAEPGLVSDHALTRGAEQCGTLGSGNHFLEVQIVDHVFNEDVAKVFGLEKDQVCVMIHSGSRGLGYQVCDDGLASLRQVPEKYGIALPDRQLACAPVNSAEGQKYIGAMRAAANFGFCNRQLLMHQTRDVFANIFGQPWHELGMTLLYDVAHNIAKLEEHDVNGVKKKLWVHRKGATRAFPAGHPELPDVYRSVGQPVIIPGDMGRASWIMVGQPGSMKRTFGTTCHGAGRAMSRTAALKEAGGRRIDKELEARGVIARAQSRKGLAEEQPKAYKNVDDVVDVVHQAGLSAKVARMRPIGVIKG